MAEDSKLTGTPAVERFTQMMERLQIPGVDVRALIENQRKNLDALTKATQVATEGATAVSQRQAEILQGAIEQASSMVRDFKVTGSPGETAAAQQRLVTEAVETAMANARELAEMVEQASREAFEVIQRRTRESIEELRASAAGKAGKSG
jgi:phasin family protein